MWEKKGKRRQQDKYGKKMSKMLNWIDGLPRDRRDKDDKMGYRYSYSLAVSPV